jgi:predicted DNA-binding protein with PD1-like motif
MKELLPERETAIRSILELKIEIRFLRLLKEKYDYILVPQVNELEIISMIGRIIENDNGPKDKTST